jgi:hypothetical protein
MPTAEVKVDPEQLAFLRVPVKCITLVVTALRTAGFTQEAERVSEFTKNYTDPTANAARHEWLVRAEAQAAKAGEIEFDSDATISGSEEGGEYVLGWVWVYGPSD